MARESPTAATSPALEQQVQLLAKLLEACPPSLSHAEKVILADMILQTRHLSGLPCCGSLELGTEMLGVLAGVHPQTAALCSAIFGQQVRLACGCVDSMHQGHYSKTINHPQMLRCSSDTTLSSSVLMRKVALAL